MITETERIVYVAARTLERLDNNYTLAIDFLRLAGDDASADWIVSATKPQETDNV